MVWCESRKDPIDKVGSPSASLRKPQLTAPPLSEDSDEITRDCPVQDPVAAHQMERSAKSHAGHILENLVSTSIHPVRTRHHRHGRIGPDGTNPEFPPDAVQLDVFHTSAIDKGTLLMGAEPPRLRNRSIRWITLELVDV